jgi:hypothetical protein
VKGVHAGDLLHYGGDGAGWVGGTLPVRQLGGCLCGRNILLMVTRRVGGSV